MPDRIQCFILFHIITKQVTLYLRMTNPGWKKILLTLEKQSFWFVLFETNAGCSSLELNEKHKA